jgi:hypothetical protein
MSEREESFSERIRVLFGHYYCPDCYQWKCTDMCGRRHQKELSEIGELIGREQFDDARKLIADLVSKIGENEPEVIRLTTLMSFLEGDD